MIGPRALDDPEPEERSNDVDPAVRRKRPSGMGRVYSGQTKRKDEKAHNAEDRPPGRASQPKPGPKSKATRESRGNMPLTKHSLSDG